MFGGRPYKTPQELAKATTAAIQRADYRVRFFADPWGATEFEVDKNGQPVAAMEHLGATHVRTMTEPRRNKRADKSIGTYEFQGDQMTIESWTK